MRFNCSQSDLARNLATIGLAIPSNTAHPILTNVAIITDIDNNKVTLIGSDLHFTIKTVFDCQVLENGSVTVPYKFLSSMIQKLPDGELAFACEDEDADNPKLDIHSLSGKYNLKGLSYDMYPNTIQEIQNPISIELDTDILKRGLEHVLRSFAKDETKQILTGVNFKFNTDNQLVLASTDGHRLSCITLDEAVSITTEEISDSEVKEEPFAELEDNNYDIPQVQLTIKGDELNKLLKILILRNDEKITLQYNDKNLCFYLKDIVISSRILTGNFPKYEQLLPKEFLGWLVCDKDAFTKALDRISVLLDGKNNLVKLEMNSTDEMLTLYATARDLGEAKSNIRCELSEARTIGFNYLYLLDAIKSCKMKEIKIQFNESNAPIIIAGLGDPDAITLVMPVQIRD
jgi:DNA polymerase-3 subunit beta